MKKYRLADIAEIVISSVDKKTKPGEKIVKLCNFTDVYHNWAIKQSDYDSFMVASASDSNINKLSLKKGLVAFTKDSETRDDIGISTYIADDFDDVVLGYHCALAKPNKKIVYGKYLNAFMSSDYIKKYFELNATGSGMRFTLAVSTMEDMPIMLPSLNIQKKIGDMLSDFDKRIENLRAQNRVLEQTAKTIYDYTFLQCAGHQTTYNNTLNRNIPTNWEVKKMSELAEVVNGATPSTSVDGNFDGDIVWITPKDLSDQKSKFVYFGERTITQKGYDSCSTTLVPVNSILMSSRAPIGLVSIAKCELCTNQGFKTFVPKSDDYTEYLYYYLQTNMKKIEQLGSGTTFKEVSRGSLTSFPVVVPDKKTLDAFNFSIKPLFEKQLVNTKQIESLTTQRNTLLPLLMIGQVKIV